MGDYETQYNFENCKSGFIMLLENQLASQNAIICFNMVISKANFELHAHTDRKALEYTISPRANHFN